MSASVVSEIILPRQPLALESGGAQAELVPSS
jgi:hypothetical protein